MSAGHALVTAQGAPEPRGASTLRVTVVAAKEKKERAAVRCCRGTPLGPIALFVFVDGNHRAGMRRPLCGCHAEMLP
jgi:hypothetical protein